MAQAVSVVALTSVVITAVWLGRKLFIYCLDLYRIHWILQTQFPCPPGSLLLGHATPELFGSRRPYLQYTEVLKKYGRTVTCRVAHQPIVLTCDPLLIAATLDRSLDGTTFDKPKHGKHLNIGNPDPSRKQSGGYALPGPRLEIGALHIPQPCHQMLSSLGCLSFSCHQMPLPCTSPLGS
eukprot:jgi/Botrbrau1/17994/Bobra.0713s0001.1